MKMYEFRFKYHWSLFLRGSINNIISLVQIMAWRRQGDKPLSEPMVFIYWRIYVSLSLNELNKKSQPGVSDANWTHRTPVMHKIILWDIIIVLRSQRCIFRSLKPLNVEHVYDLQLSTRQNIKLHKTLKNIKRMRKQNALTFGNK